VISEYARIIERVHALPGRLRLRLPWLRDEPEDARALADELARLDVSVVVEVRPLTGSVLCSYDPERLDESQIVAAVRRVTRTWIVAAPGERNPEVDAERARATRALPHTSTLRTAIADSLERLNHDVLRASGGRLDLGAVTGLSFLAIGAAEVAITRRLPAPPWFNLAWWAFRSFTLLSTEEVLHAERATPGPQDEAVTSEVT
jgi:hypothetical protein